MRFRDFGCEPSFVSLEDDDVVVSTSVSNTRADREVSKNVNKSHIEPWLTVPEEVTGEAHFFTVWKNHVIVGEIILWGFTEGDDDSYVCFVSYWIDRNYTNKGVGTKAVSLCVKHAFDNLNVDRVEAAIQPENFASSRLAEKVGFKKITVIPDFFRVAGVKTPHDLWAIDRN